MLTRTKYRTLYLYKFYQTKMLKTTYLGLKLEQKKGQGFVYFYVWSK